MTNAQAEFPEKLKLWTLRAALENHQRILELKRQATQRFILLGREFRENKEQRYFELLGFPTFEVYIESPEVCFQRRSVYSLIAIYEKFVEELGYSVEELSAVDYSKLDRLLPLLNVQPVAHREWFEKAKRLTRRELEVEIRAFRRESATADPSALLILPEVPLPDGWVNSIQQGNCLNLLQCLPDDSIDFCMTSPPYWGLRDYGVLGQFGLEANWQEYVGKSVRIYEEVKRVLKKEGSFYLNLGDTYAGSNCGFGDYREKGERGLNPSELYISVKKPQAKTELPPKCLIGIPWRVALAMIDEGWILRNAIIWHKPNPMPSSVKDRLNNTYEFVFHFVKSPQYYYDLDAIRENHKPENLARYSRGFTEAGNKEPYKLNNPSRNRNAFRAEGKYTKADRGRVDPRYNPGSGPMSWAAWKEEHPSTTQPLGKNPGDVITGNPGDFWEINTQPFPEAHFAVYPEELCVKPIRSSCPEAGIVLDIFAGAGTTLLVAKKLGRKYLGFEINPDYIEIASRRLTEIG